ncbi:hypothetical protein [Gracilibacillus saliphilus]|uniref:hypothetical protein n=1 Tax=Gracilibacillus saliphilus TaxID=543890 RepID=UPI0013D02675|nr:hypothetical protein [Gracilibacillus saliphilus]
MMLCRCKELSHLKIEADFGADPIWCYQCGYNLDIEFLPLSDSLKQELIVWVLDLEKWYDWEKGQLIKSKRHLAHQHNHLGEILTEKVKQELAPSLNVFFVSFQL